MKIPQDKNENQNSNKSPKKNKEYLEDYEKPHNEKNKTKNKNNEEDDANILHTKKFSKKALRKILRKLVKNFCKDEINMMIWENDENLDGYVDFKEFEKMYKRCIFDEREEEPKKLFYLVQFLMYDKEQKCYIEEEDTLEILFIRYENKFEDAITDIFAELTEGKYIDRKNPELRKRLNYHEFVERMHLLSQNKRNMIQHQKKDYCDYIPDILKKEGKPVIHEGGRLAHKFKGIYDK